MLPKYEIGLHYLWSECLRAVLPQCMHIGSTLDPQGLDGTGSGNRVPETRGIKKVPGSDDSVPTVPKVTFYFERALLYFENNDSILCKLKVYH